MAKSIRSRKPYRRTGFFVDVFDFILSVAIVVCGVMNILAPERNAKLFPIICIMGTLLNGTMSIKYYMRRDYVRAIALTVAAIILAFVAVFSFMLVYM